MWLNSVCQYIQNIIGDKFNVSFNIENFLEEMKKVILNLGKLKNRFLRFYSFFRENMKKFVHNIKEKIKRNIDKFLEKTSINYKVFKKMKDIKIQTFNTFKDSKCSFLLKNEKKFKFNFFSMRKINREYKKILSKYVNIFEFYKKNEQYLNLETMKKLDEINLLMTDFTDKMSYISDKKIYNSFFKKTSFEFKRMNNEFIELNNNYIRNLYDNFSKKVNYKNKERMIVPYFDNEKLFENLKHANNACLLNNAKCATI